MSSPPKLRKATNRRTVKKFKSQDVEDTKSANASQREQNKHNQQENVEQQGDRANVEQNTTPQNNR